jgi:hypothetical protein
VTKITGGRQAGLNFCENRRIPPPRTAIDGWIGYILRYYFSVFAGRGGATDLPATTGTNCGKTGQFRRMAPVAAWRSPVSAGCRKLRKPETVTKISQSLDELPPLGVEHGNRENRISIVPPRFSPQTR